MKIVITFDPLQGGATFQSDEQNPLLIIGVLDVVHAQIIKSLVDPPRIVVPGPGKTVVQL